MPQALHLPPDLVLRDGPAAVGVALLLDLPDRLLTSRLSVETRRGIGDLLGVVALGHFGRWIPPGAGGYSNVTRPFGGRPRACGRLIPHSAGVILSDTGA